MRKPWIEWDERYGTGRVRWREKVTLPDGKFKWVIKTDKETGSTSDKDLLEERVDIIYTRLKAKLKGEPDPTRTSKGCFDAFIAQRTAERQGERSIDNFRDAWRRWEQMPIALRMPPLLKDLTRQHLVDFKTHLYANGYAVETIITSLSRIRRWLNWAVDNEWAKESPFKRIGVPERKPKPRFLTDEEIDNLEWAADQFGDPKWKTLLRLSFDAALRPGNEWRNIDSRDLTMHPDGSGELHIRAHESKTEKSRLVPLKKSIFKDWPFGVKGKLFAEWTQSKINNWWHKTIEKAEIIGRSGSARPYDLRHTWARRHYENGGNTRLAMKIMGHKSIKMQEIYGHFQQDVLNKIVEQQPEVHPVPPEHRRSKSVKIEPITARLGHTEQSETDDAIKDISSTNQYGSDLSTW